MASRENQGLQVALILFVMMTVVLMVTTYMFYRQAEEQRGRAAAAENTVQAAQDERDKAVFQAQALRFMVGASELTRQDIDRQLDSDPEMKKMFAQFDEDMNLYGVGLEANRLNYRELPRQIIDAIQTRNKEVTSRTRQTVSLATQLKDTETSASERITLADNARDAAKTDLNQQTKAFNDKVAELNAKQAEALNKYQTVSAQVAQAQQKAASQINAAQTQVKQMETIILNQKQRIRAEQPKPPKVADGLVTLTNAEGGFVLINLGSADNLKVRTTFNVYEAGEIDLENADVKGKIEVTAILDDHRAKARITDTGETGNPILSDDVIYSEVFDPGQSLHVALAGFMDLNNDGRSDREYVKMKLINSGATIDAELRDDGVPKGRVGDQTSYLVIGERPGPNASEEFRREFGLLTDQAADRGMEVVTAPEILRLIGWKPEARKVTLGANASEGADAQTFQPRRPPGAGSGGNSAY